MMEVRQNMGYNLREKLNNDFIKAIKLSRGFGKESATDAGLNHVDNNLDFYIMAHPDLQHPINEVLL